MIKHIPWHKNNPLPTLTVEKLEQQGLDIGKQYKWDKRIYKVSK